MFIVLSMCCDAHTRVSLPEHSALDRSATESWSFRCFRRSAFVMRGCRDALCVGLCCLWAYNMVMLLCMLVTARRSRSVGTARASRGDIRVSSLRRGSASRSRHSRHSRYASFRRWTGRDSVSSARGADSAASRVANLGGVFSHDVTRSDASRTHVDVRGLDGIDGIVETAKRGVLSTSESTTEEGGSIGGDAW